jgi:class 3 adenylate cyclase
MENPPHPRFGHLIGRHRLDLGLTQEELAERAGVSPSSLSDLERGVARSHYPHTMRGLVDGLQLDGAQRAAFMAATRGAPQPKSETTAVSEPRAAVLTFLIADLRGYTTFTHERGDAAAARLAARFASLVREVAAAHGGAFVELRGDEALATFASTRHALKAGVALQSRLAEAVMDDPSLPLHAGIGIDVGEARSTAVDRHIRELSDPPPGGARYGRRRTSASFPYNTWRITIQTG